jgi:hypothetical protein
MQDRDSDHVRVHLERLGFTVERIKQARLAKRPDLLAVRDNTRMFVEVKARVQDSALRTQMETVPVGATESILTPLEKQNVLSSEVKDANDQLQALASAGDLRVLWCRADNDLFVHGAREQIVSTLLGIRVVDCARGGARGLMRCAYAGFADFYRFREIDGAIVEKDGGLTLVLNQFSRRHAAFAGSHLCKSLPPEAIVDVARAAQDGLCYVVDGEVDRHDDQAVLAFLRTKHPSDTFHGFVPHRAGTSVTVIDARSA